jgi:pilus assembly protein Flp/PilA
VCTFTPSQSLPGYPGVCVTQKVTPHHTRRRSVQIIKRFMKDESGATAIEYALIAAGIGIAIITAVNALGTEIGVKFNTIKTELSK